MRIGDDILELIREFNNASIGADSMGDEERAEQMSAFIQHVSSTYQPEQVRACANGLTMFAAQLYQISNHMETATERNGHG